MELTSSAFARGAEIPRKYTGEGEDVSPPLSWSGAPGVTRSYALLCEDPDAPGGTFVHWTLYDLPPDSTGLPEAVPENERLSGGGAQGRNSFGRLGWAGPCPPAGPSHRYVFTLYALDAPLGLKPGATADEARKRLESRVLESAELTGRYRKAPVKNPARMTLRGGSGSRPAGQSSSARRAPVRRTRRTA